MFSVVCSTSTIWYKYTSTRASLLSKLFSSGESRSRVTALLSQSFVINYSALQFYLVSSYPNS